MWQRNHRSGRIFRPETSCFGALWLGQAVLPAAGELKDRGREPITPGSGCRYNVAVRNRRR